MNYDNLSNEKQDAIETLIERHRVVEVKSTREINVYLKNYDDSFSDSGIEPYSITQVHPRRERESRFAARVFCVAPDDS